jgi:hypothetical protein
MEERSNFIRAMDKMMHSTSCFQFHIRKTEHYGSPNTMRFHFAPNLLRRIQLILEFTKPPVLTSSNSFRHLNSSSLALASLTLT